MTLDLCSAANKIALKHNLLISLTLPLEILNIESRALGLNISFLKKIRDGVADSRISKQKSSKKKLQPGTSNYKNVGIEPGLVSNYPNKLFMGQNKSDL